MRLTNAEKYKKFLRKENFKIKRNWKQFFNDNDVQRMSQNKKIYFSSKIYEIRQKC